MTYIPTVEVTVCREVKVSRNCNVNRNEEIKETEEQGENRLKKHRAVMVKTRLE